MKNECPVCEYLKTQGIIDPQTVIRHPMIWQNIYVNKIVELIGVEKASVIVALVDKETEIELKKQDN